MAVGDLEQNIKVTQRDEIGELANSINEMITTFREVVRQADAISSGDYTVEIKLRSDQDKLGIALQRMTRTLREASQATEKIAAGDLDVSVEVKGEKDLLGQSINNMVQTLKDADKENKKQTWLKTGQNDLNEKMRGDQDVVELSRNVISYLAKYLDAQIGALYLLNEEKGKLELTGSYAFTKRKGLNNTIAIGEGLVGQAAFEKEMISVNGIPEDYTRIGSATGNAIPRNVVVSPFMYEGKLSGVIELGSFHEFSDEKLDFLKIVIENIAIGFNSALARNLQQELLQKTKQQAKELEAQQEQLKTTNAELEEQTEILKINEAKLQEQQEELQAANEELEEKTEYLEKQSEEIREKNRDLEKVRQEIERKAEELEISSKYKSEFLANMSHELRTPLNSLLLLARNLMENKEGALTEDQVESARIIYQSGNDLLALINEILDLSKIESGKMVLNIESFKIEEIAENMKSIFRHVAKDKGLSFKIKLDKKLPPAMRSDRQRLEQIVKNLISNALKFTETGSITVKFFRPPQSTDLSRCGLDLEQAIAIAVADTGIGIPEEKQMEIFEAFQQADGSTSRQYGGTGLGLSISRELAKLLGGEIQLVSAPGKGSTFTLYIRQDLAGGSVPHSASVQPSSQPRNPVPAPKTPQTAAVIPSPGIKDDRDNLKENDQVLLVIEDDLKFARVLYQFAHEKNF
ncbi:MAG: ATP-binding protein, partial [bacterium]